MYNTKGFFYKFFLLYFKSLHFVFICQKNLINLKKHIPKRKFHFLLCKIGTVHSILLQKLFVVALDGGQQVNIWSEPWLPDLQNPYIESPITEELDCATVNSIIDETESTWDTDILMDLFTSRDRFLIQQ